MAAKRSKPNGPTPSTGARWVLFMPSIPAKPASIRVKIIHDLDMRDDKFGREEIAGVRSAIDGICTVARDDAQRIAAASPMLDGLYSHFSLRTRRRAARTA